MDILSLDRDSLIPFVESSLQNGRPVEFTVTGKSMLPLLANGRDSVVLTPILKLKKFKIVFYKRDNGKYILHRIIKIRKDGVYCAGDNQTVLEGPLAPSQFIGEVNQFIRKGKRRSIGGLFHRIYTLFWCANLKARPRLFKLLVFLTGKRRKK